MSYGHSAHPAISSPALWLLLALVIEKPSYGEELNAHYTHHYGSFAPARSDAARLRRLEQLGLVEALPPAPSSGSPGPRGQRIYFKATADGVLAHQRWLTSPVKQENWRAELLARIATAATLGPAAILTLIARYHQHAVNDARHIERLLVEQVSKPESLAALVATLVLQEQRLTLAAQRQWVEIARRAVHEHNQRTRGRRT